MQDFELGEICEISAFAKMTKVIFLLENQASGVGFFNLNNGRAIDRN